MGKCKIATILTIVLLVLGFMPTYTFLMLSVKEEYRTLVGWLIPLIYVFICIVINTMIIFLPTTEQRENN